MKKRVFFALFGALIVGIGIMFLHFEISEDNYAQSNVGRHPEERVPAKEASVQARPPASPSSDFRPEEKTVPDKQSPPSQHALPFPKKNKDDDTTPPDRRIQTNGFLPERPAEVFSDTVANRDTIRVFKELQYRFNTSSDDLETHMAEVRGYLAGELDENRLGEVMDLYEKFTEYEITLVAKVPAWGRVTPSDQAETLELLETIQGDRTDFFGHETADALYGEEYRWQRYQILKQGIVNDARASGREKEEGLEALKSEIWGTAVNVEEMKSPLERYDELVILYKNDLERMTENEKAETLKRFRHQTLPPEAARRLDRMAESQAP